MKDEVKAIKPYLHPSSFRLHPFTRSSPNDDQTSSPSLRVGTPVPVRNLSSQRVARVGDDAEGRARHTCGRGPARAEAFAADIDADADIEVEAVAPAARRAAGAAEA